MTDVPVLKQLHRDPIFWKDLVAGYISGVANILAGQPFDICKVRIQTQGGGSFPVVLVNIIKNEGLFALWKGSLFPLICFGACNSICFAVNEYYKDIFKKRSNRLKATISQTYLSGGLAGIANSVISGPMEHLRIRMQMQKDPKTKIYKNSVDAATKIFKNHGLRGIYKGQIITMYREFFLYGAYFAGYEKCKRLQNDPGFLWMLVSGGVGGCSGWVGAFFIDTVKTKVQTDDFVKPKLKSLWDVPKTFGPRDLVKGFVPGFIRGFPVNAITFTVFEIACKYMYKDGYQFDLILIFVLILSLLFQRVNLNFYYLLLLI